MPEQTNSEAVAVTENAYTAEDVLSQIKPLSKNGFLRFFQGLWRKWLGVWYGFCDKHGKLADLIYKVFFFVAFSMGVTVWQYIVMTFLPYAFASLNNGAAGWPGVTVGKTGQQYMIFGDAQGWGYFIAFEIAVFTAQCINFPLQRNITYRSHGNPWYQAMWYFIGWVLVSVATSAIWGICNVYLVYWGVPDAVTGLLKTVLTGGVSMVIFFFVFLVIFPDNNKIAKSARAKYEKLIAANAAAPKIDAAKAKAEEWEYRAELSSAEKEYAKARAQASNTAMRYGAMLTARDKAKTDEEKAEYAQKVDSCFAIATAAIEVKIQKEGVYNAVKSKATK